MEGELFKSYAVYGGLVLVKTVLMSPLTSRFRLKNSVIKVWKATKNSLKIVLIFQTFANPEDLPLGTNPNLRFDDPDVERVRRIHQVNNLNFCAKRSRLCDFFQNDLENVVPFMLIGALFCTTNPALATAKLLFRTFAFARFGHTFAYYFALPQPSRFLCFGTNLWVNLYMGYTVISTFWSNL